MKGGDHMHQFVKTLNDYLKKNQPNYDCCDIHLLLEHIWTTYTECNPIDNSTIRSSFSDLYAVLGKLSLQESDLLFEAVSTLCLEYERLAFVEGIKLGARLNMELSDA